MKFDQLPEPLVMGEEAEVDIDTGRLEAPAVPLAAIMDGTAKPASWWWSRAGWSSAPSNPAE